MLTHSIYESDNRVMRYAEALAERGDEVDVLCVKRDRNQPDTETINRVQRTPRPATIQQAWQGPDSLSAAATPVLVQLHRVVDLEESETSVRPDPCSQRARFSGVCRVGPKLTGAKVVLDIHDIVPEFYGSKFGKQEDTTVVRPAEMDGAAVGRGTPTT